MEGVPSEVDAPLKEGIPIGGPSNVDEIGEGAPSGVAAAPILPPKLAGIESNRKRPPDQVLLSTYVPPHERVYPPTGMVAPDLEGAQEIIHHWSPFNQAKPPIAHICDLYPNYFRVPMAARAEQYPISFPIYMNKEAFQSMAEDGILIRNHDFHHSAKLVRASF